MRFRWAEELFASRDYRGAVTVLEELISGTAGKTGHQGFADARTLLTRSYYHSAPAASGSGDTPQADAVMQMSDQGFQAFTSLVRKPRMWTRTSRSHSAAPESRTHLHPHHEVGGREQAAICVKEQSIRSSAGMTCACLPGRPSNRRQTDK